MMVQYFIKPIVYQTVSKDKLTVDFTLNVINDSVVKIVSNFSSQNNKINNILIGSSFTILSNYLMIMNQKNIF